MADPVITLTPEVKKYLESQGIKVEKLEYTAEDLAADASKEANHVNVTASNPKGK